MEQRLSLVTLGVRDLAASTAFFERLGWRRASASTDGIVFFQCGSIGLSLYPRAALAEDVGLPDVDPAEPPAFGAVTLAHNARSKPEVDALLDAARAAGGEIVKPAQDVFWGGYSGYFRDLDGHLWEVAWNPFLPIDESGAVHFPE